MASVHNLGMEVKQKDEGEIAHIVIYFVSLQYACFYN